MKKILIQRINNGWLVCAANHSPSILTDATYVAETFESLFALIKQLSDEDKKEETKNSFIAVGDFEYGVVYAPPVASHIKEYEYGKR